MFCIQQRSLLQCSVFYNVLFCNVLYSTTFSSAMFCILQRSLLQCSVFYNVLFYNVLYSTMFSSTMFCILQRSLLQCSVFYNVLYCNVLYSTTFSSAMFCILQRSLLQCSVFYNVLFYNVLYSTTFSSAMLCILQRSLLGKKLCLTYLHYLIIKNHCSIYWSQYHFGHQHVIVAEPDCTRCDYTKGQIWLPDSQNCHDYYICEKVDTWGGRWYWTYHHVSCGLLYWDQSRLTCTPMIQPGCEEQIPVVVEQPDLSGGMCKVYVC